jgi:hypothetical protein
VQIKAKVHGDVTLSLQCVFVFAALPNPTPAPFFLRLLYEMISRLTNPWFDPHNN